MSLTSGRGPLGPTPAGTFSEPPPAGIVYAEPFQRRVRGLRDGVAVVDTERALLIHRSGRAPTFAFPSGDVRDVTAAPEPDAPGHVTVAWDAVDAWFEEEERIESHPRNPYHRVDCIRTTRRLRVEVGGTVLVDTDETMGVYETALAPRLYVPPSAVRIDLLRPSETTTYCPYKGTASYWTAVVDGTVVEDVAWSYEQPLPESTPITGMLSFYAHLATVTADLPET